MPPGVELDQAAVGDAGETWFTLCTVKALKDVWEKPAPQDLQIPALVKL